MLALFITLIVSTAAHLNFHCYGDFVCQREKGVSEKVLRDKVEKQKFLLCVVSSSIFLLHFLLGQP